MPKSGIVVLPNNTQPASRTRAAGGASEALGAMSPAAVPKGVGMPLVAMLSLIVIGTPSIALSGLRRRQRSCEAAAIASAPAASMTYIALILLLPGIDAGQRRARHLDRRELSGAIGGRQLVGGKVVKCAHGSRSLIRRGPKGTILLSASCPMSARPNHEIRDPPGEAPCQGLADLGLQTCDRSACSCGSKRLDAFGILGF